MRLKLAAAAFTLAISLALVSVGNCMPKLSYVGEIKAGKPVHIAIDRDGTIYLPQDIGTISVMNSSGVELMVMGGKDKKWKDILRSPSAIAFDSERLLIADTGTDAISVFSSTGEYIETIGTGGSSPKQFSNPSGIFVYRGVIYVADNGNDRVQMLGANGVLLGQIGKSEQKEVQLGDPMDVAVDYRGYVYAVDGSDKSVKVYDRQGELVTRIASFEAPGNLAMDIDGFYVADLRKRKISKYSYDFKQVLVFGAEGNGTGKFKEISGIALDPDGRVYVADKERGIVQIFDIERNGEPTLSITAPPPSSVIWEDEYQVDRKQELGDMAWDGKGALYAVDMRNDSILVIRDGKVERELKQKDWEPVAVALDSTGSLWVLDADDKRLMKIGKEGKTIKSEGCSGSREGCFSTPTDMAITRSGLIYISDSGNDRIQVYNTDGLPLKVMGEGVLKDPVSLSYDDAEGLLYVLDKGRKMVTVMKPDGSVLIEFGGKDEKGREAFGEPVSIDVTGTEVLVLDKSSATVKAFTKQGKPFREFGSPGKSKGDFYGPEAIEVVDDLTIFVADTDNNRIQKFSNVFTPAKPDGLVATPGTRSVDLAWKPNMESFVEKYVIYRAESADGVFEIAGESAEAGFLDKDVMPEKTYRYRVSAVATKGFESLLTDEAGAVPTKYLADPPKGIKAESHEWSVELKWLSPPEDQKIDHYSVYRVIHGAYKEIGQSNEPSLTDMFLDPNTEYEYFLTATSIDGVESEKSSIKARTLVATRPPLEVDVVKIEDIFSNTYKYYENKGIGTVRITNNTHNKIARLKMAFSIKEFMDFPTEVEVTDLAPMEKRETTLKAVFNNNILDVTEDSPVQAEITLSYYSNQELKSFTKNQTLNIYEKHKMMWNVRDRLAAFVTTKDPVVIDFTRGVVTQYNETNEPLLYAGVLFNALGQLGITYMQDPSNSYQLTYNMVDYVDFLQYPRETLMRKSGDCDDLVILYSALLESLGITTKIVDIPGHMFMMFSVGTVEELGADTSNGWLVVYDEHVWVPVEVTMVGKPFMKAWEKGSATFYEWKGSGKIGIMGLGSAWATFKPATLKPSEWRPAKLGRDEIEKRYNNEFEELRKIRVKLRSKKYLNALQQNPNDADSHMQLGIVYAQAGDTKEAMKHLQKAAQLDPANASVVCNIGNVNYLDNKDAEAIAAYEKAAQLDPNDSLTWVNLARAYNRKGDKEKAKDAFIKAKGIDSSVTLRFRSLSLTLIGPI